ncbi:MAG TPA: M28 family peptidase [Granulicella sp.]|nr:M28 family peptidase [Granulicella sp.]
MRKLIALLPLTLVVALSAATSVISEGQQQLAARHDHTGHPRDTEIHDADTRAWWHTTEALSGDDMEGRDTGSAAYQRAAEYVAGRFQRAGLAPAGEDHSYFQPVRVHEVAVGAAGTSFTLLREKGGSLPIAFLEQITVNPAANLPVETEAGLTFRGYCGKEAMQEIAGKIVVCFGTQRQGLPTGAERVANARAGGAKGLINVDDPYFTIEPPRWPAAYARSVVLDSGAAPAAGAPLLVMRVSVEVFTRMLEGTGKDAAAVLAAGGHKQALESFDIPARLAVKLHLTERRYASPNVLGVLPGSDPKLKDEYVVVAAHLDGYGYGTPVAGDRLYNGALDDAAYVALLIQFAEDLRREHRTLKRSVLFCAFTGEEKGLLGANYFVEHPTVPKAQLAADINLDQLRPLFPLHILTALALDETTLGATARQVAGPMGIELRADREPERGLVRRADHAPFLRIGVPAIGFIFGYDPGTEAERRYREWYQVRYHRPQDDLTQPMDFDAATKFNQFFYRLAEAVAEAPVRPAFVSR